MDFINTESFCRFSKTIKTIQSFCLFICVSLFHENKVLLYCSMLITFSQINRLFGFRLLRYSSYCSWIRKPSLGENLQIFWPFAGQPASECCSAAQHSTAGNQPQPWAWRGGYWGVLGGPGWHPGRRKKFITGKEARATTTRGNAALHDP